MLMLSRLLIYGVVAQFFLVTWLLANESTAQDYQSIREKTIDISVNEVSIREVFDFIESETDYKFFYDDEILHGDVKLSLQKKNIQIADILLEVSRVGGLKFKQINQIINVNERSAGFDDEEPIEVVIQTRTITGKITSLEDDEGLPGVNVVLKGTTVGTVTDVDGNYMIDVPDATAVLVFSSVGFLREEIVVGTRTVIDMQMSPDIQTLKELVVVGYGIQKRSDLTGSISSVRSEDLRERPATNLAEKIQGKASGVDVAQNSGAPGSAPTIRIRGRRSFSASNDPLYVVDGIPFQQGSINDLNPNDVVSVEILKDAASCAIYGSRGANGVILITTNRGKVGKTKVSYNAFYGPTQISEMVDMMNGEEFAEYRREAHRASNSYINDEQLFEPLQLENLKNGMWYNYPDLIFSNGYKTNHQLSFSGGNEKTQFASSFDFFDEQGTIKTMFYRRYSVRLNLDHQASEWLKFGMSTTLSRSLQEAGNASGTLVHALQNSPLGQPFDPETGELNFFPTSDGLLANPLFNLDTDNLSNETKRNRAFSSIFTEINFFKYFRYKLNFGFDISDYRRGSFYGSHSTSRLGGDAYASGTNWEEFNYTLENLLYYTREFSKHQLDATLMQSIQSYTHDRYDIAVSGLPYESQKWYNMDSGNTIEDIGSGLGEWSLASFMGRLNYKFNEKYLLQATIRADGSSRLAKNNKWSYFPSGAIGWRVSEEPWMKSIPGISFLKLRTSYGVTGNTSISPYQTQGTLSRTIYAWEEQIAQGYRLRNIPSPNLEWEKTASFTTGLDFGFFDDRLSGSVDYYHTKTTGLLMQRQLPATSGYTRILENIGSTQNNGVEVSLEGIAFDHEKFNWTIGINWHKNHEEIVELYGGKEDDIGNKWFIGQPLTVFYDYEKIGIWQIEEADVAESYNSEPGKIKVKDQNDDGAITADDRIILGSNVPTWSMGLTSRMHFNGFDFSFFIYTRQGATIYSGFHRNQNYLSGRYNNLDVDYWTPDNPTNAYPRPNSSDVSGSSLYGPSLAYFDGSFIKINNVTLGYTLPERLLNPLKISSLRVYVTADRPFIFSEFEGFDPEIYNGVLSTYVPSNRSIVFGANLNF